MKIDINNMILCYQRSGMGDPLLLLHGNGEDHHIFDQITEKLKQHFTVYAIDSRNHGGSSDCDDFSYEAMSADVLLFIERLGLHNVSIVGFSDGAIIALLLALSKKNIFKKMALLGINLTPTDFKQEIYDDLIEEYKKTKDPLVRLMLEQPNISLYSLEEIEIPTLVVAGENDLFPEKSFKAIVQTLPNATLAIMNGHDHASYIVNNDILYPILNDFFNS